MDNKRKEENGSKDLTDTMEVGEEYGSDYGLHLHGLDGADYPYYDNDFEDDYGENK